MPRRHIKQILIVEDDEDDEFFLKWMLGKAGIETRIVQLHGGQAAIDYFALLRRENEEDGDFSSDLIFLDLKMPGVSGFDVLAWLEDVETEKCPLVAVLTASDNPSETNIAARLGAHHHLTKPVTVAGLIRFGLANEIAWEHA